MKKITHKKSAFSIPFACLARQNNMPITSHTPFDRQWKFLIMILTMACKSFTTVTDIY